jgi:hypothetical protein
MHYRPVSSGSALAVPLASRARRFSLAVAAVLALSLLVVLSSAAESRADSYSYFCPGTSSTMTIGAGDTCVHGNNHYVTQVNTYRLNNTAYSHCSGGNATTSPSSTHVIGYVCDYGTGANGFVYAGYYSGGIYAYPASKNREGVSGSGFFGSFNYVTGTRRRSVSRSAQQVTHRPAKVARATSRKLGVFRRAAVRRDDVGGLAQGAMVPLFFADQTRAIPAGRTPLTGAALHPDDGKIFVAAGPESSVCLLLIPDGADGPAGQCGKADSLGSGRSVVTINYSDRDVALAGLVPDGVDHVSVTLVDGSVVELAVVDNVYRGRFGVPTKSVSFKGPDGAVTVPALG